MKKKLFSISALAILTGLTVGCSCHHNDPVLDSIAITKTPNKTEYVVGDTFSLEGLEITANYTNDTKEVVTDYTSSLAEGYVFVVSDVGSKEITITYQEKITSFSVTVTSEEPPVKELVSIAVTSEPTKTHYIVGDEFDPTGLVVTATYNDESTEIITNYTLSQPDMSSKGTKLVVVTYLGKTDQFNIVIDEPVDYHVTDIAVTTNPTKMEYFVGEAFDPTGMVVTATYSDGSEIVVTGYTCSSVDTSTEGNKTVTITYSENTYSVSTTITINVVKVVLSSIEITKEPTKLQYYPNEVIDLTGIEVTAHYNDQSQHKVTGCTVGEVDTSSLGKKTVTISYSEGNITKTDTFEIEVIARPASMALASIAITKEAINKQYLLGETIDYSGLEVTATYSDQSSSVINISALDIEADISSVGDKTVSISYTEGDKTKSTSYQVSVLPGDAIYQVGVNDFIFDENEKTITFNRGESDEKIIFSFYNVELSNQIFVVKPGGYITLQGEESLAKICYILVGSGIDKSMPYVAHIGFVGGSSESSPFKVSESFSLMTSVMNTVKFASLPSYFAIENQGSENLEIKNLAIIYKAGKHLADPYQNDEHYGFVSSVSQFINDELIDDNSSQIAAGQYFVNNPTIKQAKFTYRQGNMVWSKDGLVNEPKPFDIYIDIFVPTTMKQYITFDAYVKDGENIDRSAVELGTVKDIDLVYRDTTTTLSILNIKVSNTALYHAGGPFLYIDMDVDVTDVDINLLYGFALRASISAISL